MTSSSQNWVKKTRISVSCTTGGKNIKIRNYNNFGSKNFFWQKISEFWNIHPYNDVIIPKLKLSGQNLHLSEVCFYFFEITEAHIDHPYDVRTKIKISKFVKPVLRSQYICLKIFIVILILSLPFVHDVRITTFLDKNWG